MRVAASTGSLTDFTGFIATAFKVPLLAEMVSPVPYVRVPDGTFTARQLIDLIMRQLPAYTWHDEVGVAHIYHRRLIRAPGNLLNVRTSRFWFLGNVADFVYRFPHCIKGTVDGYDCLGGAFDALYRTDLQAEKLPYMEEFKDEQARNILLRALQSNGRFYVLIAFESATPKLHSDFPYRNWFTNSLVPNTPPKMWIQNPPSYHSNARRLRRGQHKP